ncbi:MAG: hypothetical protein JSU98_06530 [Gemmatimonadales bacterium]|nr:MAG: hypothetical protein JSU98_06530 [Gemmatimonadales bacterium]
MLRWPVTVGMVFLLNACASSAPQSEDAAGPDLSPDPAGADAAERPRHEPGTGLAAGDSLAVRIHRPGMEGRMGTMEREFVGDTGQAHMHRGMHQEEHQMGAGMHRGMHEGEHQMGAGMHRGTHEGEHQMGAGMHRGAMQGRPGAASGQPTSTPREVSDDLTEGERIFNEICSGCHTVDPPPNLAPPMSHVARHLRGAFDSQEEALAHVIDYVPSPSRERSILPDMPHERFGLMPALPLPRDLLEAVGRYIWSLGADG